MPDSQSPGFAGAWLAVGKKENRVVPNYFGRVGSHFDNFRNDHCGIALGGYSTTSNGFGLLRLADFGDSVIRRRLDLGADNEFADSSSDQATSDLYVLDPALKQIGVAKR